MKNPSSVSIVMLAFILGNGCSLMFSDTLEKETWANMSAITVVKASSARMIWSYMSSTILGYQNSSVTNVTNILAPNPS